MLLLNPWVIVIAFIVIWTVIQPVVLYIGASFLLKKHKWRVYISAGVAIAYYLGYLAAKMPGLYDGFDGYVYIFVGLCIITALVLLFEFIQLKIRRKRSKKVIESN